MIQELATRYGTMFVPDTDSGQYWWLANTAASPEDEFIEKVCDLLDERPRGVALDVGTNFGCWTLPLAKHAAWVVAFEPQKCCHELIQRSVVVNQIENVWAYNWAVGSGSGFVNVPQLDIETSANFGGVTLIDGQFDASTHEVRLVPLDDFLGWGGTSFIKIDVEGGELAVLRGARNFIARDRPIIMLEMDHPLTDLAALEAHLTDAGYAFDQYGPNYLCMPL